MDRSSNDVRAAADRLLRSGYVDDPAIRSEGTIGDPLPIRAPDGAPAGWFVPVTSGELLCGFFQFDPQRTLLRFSRFPKYPPAKSWLDAHTIRELALEKFPDLAPAGTPFMTYDRNVTRLAWAVPVSGGRTIYVTGNYAWLD